MSHSPALLQTVADLRAYVSAARAAGERVALVPTMGALHEGHLALVRAGQARAQRVIVSIFVNPAQFGPNEDFSAYPRTWEADLEKLAAAQASAVFHPQVAEMYPPGMATSVIVRGVSEGLCGAMRPGHFEGVATIVAKLLLQALPDIALFGEKDYQQLMVIKRMARDLDIPAEIAGVPTMREADGLALSSRNVYLSAPERALAARLNVILFETAARIGRGTPWAEALAQGRAALAQAGFDTVEYFEARDAQSLAPPVENQRERLRLLAAIRIGRTRLIDNVAAP